MQWNDWETVMPKVQKSPRLAAIEALPDQMQDHALVVWATVANLLDKKDVQHARELITAAGVPLVEVSTRRRLPTWGAVRQFIMSRQREPLTP
jgi:hypothetical protein